MSKGWSPGRGVISWKNGLITCKRFRKSSRFIMASSREIRIPHMTVASPISGDLFCKYVSAIVSSRYFVKSTRSERGSNLLSIFGGCRI